MSKTGKCRWILMSVLVMIMAICMAFGLTACNTDDDAETPEGPALDNSPADDKGGTGDNSQTEDNNETDDKDEASSDKPLGTPVISYVYDANTVTLTQTKETADSLQITAESGDGYEIAEVTASVNGEVVYRAKRENNNYIIPANELAEGAVITLSAVSENAEVKENKVSYYYSQSAETPYLVEGYDNLAEARAAVPAQSEYFNFVNWIEADTDNGIALVANWTLDEEDIAKGITLDITHEPADETYANAKVVVNIAQALTEEVASHGATISALGVIFAKNSSAGFTSEEIALNTSKDGKVVYPWETEENMESARFSHMNSGESARLDGYYWANVYGSITMTYKIKAENLENRFFTPWVVITSGETESAVQGDVYDGDGAQHSTVIYDIYTATLSGNGVLSVFVRGIYIKTDDINNTELQLLNGEETVFSCKPTSVSNEGDYHLTFDIADKLAELKPGESTDYTVSIKIKGANDSDYGGSGVYIVNHYDYALSEKDGKTILTVKPISEVTDPIEIEVTNADDFYADNYANIHISAEHAKYLREHGLQYVTANDKVYAHNGDKGFLWVGLESESTIMQIMFQAGDPEITIKCYAFKGESKAENPEDDILLGYFTVTNPKVKPAKSLELNPTSLDLELNEEGTASATVTATLTGVEGTINWTIEGDDGIEIQVSDGNMSVTVNATAAGSATIKATIDDLEATCEVKVFKQGEKPDLPKSDIELQFTMVYGDWWAQFTIISAPEGFSSASYDYVKVYRDGDDGQQQASNYFADTNIFQVYCAKSAGVYAREYKFEFIKGGNVVATVYWTYEG